MVEDDLRAIRDLISVGGILHAQMFKDRGVWLRLCDGLDGISDEGRIESRVSALNTVRMIAEMESIDREDADEAALLAGVAAVRAELEDKANGLRRSFATSPLEGHLHPSDGYLIEQVTLATLGLLPGQEHHRGADAVVGQAAIETLADKITHIRDGMAARGYDEWTLSDPDDALYILEAVRASLDGQPVMPARAVHLLASHGLPKLFESVRGLANEIDEHFANPDQGWGP